MDNFRKLPERPENFKNDMVSKTPKISTSKHMLGRAIWDKLPECIFEKFEINKVKRGQFQNFQKSQG